MQQVNVMQSLKRHWRTSVAILLLSAALLGAFLATRDYVRPPDRWKASVTILVPAKDEKGNNPEQVPPSLLYGQARMALSANVTRGALDALNISVKARSQVRFQFEANDRGDLLSLSASALDPDLARDAALSFAKKYREARYDRVAAGKGETAANIVIGIRRYLERLVVVKAELAETSPELLPLLVPQTAQTGDDGNPDRGPLLGVPTEATYPEQLLVYEGRNLNQRILVGLSRYAENKVSSLVSYSYSGIVQRDPPYLITPPYPSWVPPAGVAAALGLLAALAVPILQERLDPSIRDPRTASRALSSVILGRIPATSRLNLSRLARPGSERDTAYRSLAATSVATDRLPRSIVVTAPVGTIQDSVAANFAAALASLGLRVALVATDARQDWYGEAGDGVPTFPDYLALASTGELHERLRDSLVTTPNDNLRVIPYGPTGSDALLEDLPALLEALMDAGIDVTVIAGPAALEDPAATIYAWSTRSVLWVVDAGEVDEHQATEAASRLALAGAAPFGIAMIDGLD